jgi:hypothetical protein
LRTFWADHIKNKNKIVNVSISHLLQRTIKEEYHRRTANDGCSPQHKKFSIFLCLIGFLRELGKPTANTKKCRQSIIKFR